MRRSRDSAAACLGELVLQLDDPRHEDGVPLVLRFLTQPQNLSIDLVADERDDSVDVLLHVLADILEAAHDLPGRWLVGGGDLPLLSL